MLSAVSTYLTVVSESKPGPQQFKINGLINGRHYLDLVGNNQIQLTLLAQRELACQQERNYFTGHQSDVAAVGLTLENNADEKIGLTFPALNALVTSLMQPPLTHPQPPHHHSAQSQEKWRPFCLNYRHCRGMWAAGCDAVDNFRPVNHSLPFQQRGAYVLHASKRTHTRRNAY